LPDRDCAAAASNGEYSIANNGVANYKAYIDSIVAVVKKYPSTNVIFVIGEHLLSQARNFAKLSLEPDSLANLVTNLNVAKCANAQAAYMECVTYAIQQLDLPNIAMYLDAGYARWLGWPANIGPAANLFGSLYRNAGSPAAVKGLATNVANYNGWNLASPSSYTSGDSNYDEKLYVNALAPPPTAQGFPAHFITDTCKNLWFTHDLDITTKAYSSKWRSTNSSACMGRLVQSYRHRLWCSTYHKHERLT